jgi:hypothetical protein
MTKHYSPPHRYSLYAALGENLHDKQFNLCINCTVRYLDYYDFVV